MTDGKVSSVLGSTNALLGKGHGQGDGSLVVSNTSGNVGSVLHKLVRVSGRSNESGFALRIGEVHTPATRVSEPFLFGSIVSPSLVRVPGVSVPARVSSIPQVSGVLCDLQNGAAGQLMQAKFGHIAERVLSPVMAIRNSVSDATVLSVFDGLPVGHVGASGFLGFPQGFNVARSSSAVGGDELQALLYALQIVCF
ncbi:hypothetical protein NE237_009376 [Protea cynaroides]|uniref:Uncharacterized protein n=1 Tax=Protea cynaroides TaxID=273540 RepID=A0A9Q0KXQ0_9MAGN|nr:hypothetical protein NE237_009376 [Protea cynaroides]